MIRRGLCVRGLIVYYYLCYVFCPNDVLANLIVSSKHGSFKVPYLGFLSTTMLFLRMYFINPTPFA